VDRDESEFLMMFDGMSVYCPTCFAIPGEACRTKYLVHGRGEVTPVVCPPHRARLVDSEKDSSRRLFAQLLCAIALHSLEQNRK
jgi:hypothetical protein